MLRRLLLWRRRRRRLLVRRSSRRHGPTPQQRVGGVHDDGLQTSTVMGRGRRAACWLLLGSCKLPSPKGAFEAAKVYAGLLQQDYPYLASGALRFVRSSPLLLGRGEHLTGGVGGGSLAMSLTSTNSAVVEANGIRQRGGEANGIRVRAKRFGF